MPPKAKTKSNDKHEEWVEFRVGMTEGSTASYSVQKKTQGDEGELYIGTYKRIIPVACKLLNPNLPDNYRDILTQETLLLSRITHSNIVRLLNFERKVDIYALNKQLTIGLQNKAVVTDEKPLKENIPVLVMEKIDGFDLSKISNSENQEWLRKAGILVGESIDEEKFLNLILNLASAVSYLHKEHTLHMDIKPSNVMYDTQRDRLTLIDLGFAIRLSDGDNLHEKVLVSFTKEYAEDKLKRWYSGKNPNWKENDPISIIEVERNELEKFFPSHDLFSLGKALDIILQSNVNIEHKDQKGTGSIKEIKSIEEILTPNLKKGLRIIIEKLESAPESSSTLNATTVYELLLRLHLSTRPPFGVPELGDTTNRGGINIQLPIANVQLSPRLSQIVNSPIVQRMRSIQQLDVLRFVFPGATQTRLVHSLLTFEFARRGIKSLLSDIQFVMDVQKSDIEAFLIYSLIHDIGHYPLSHMLEDLHSKKTKDGEEILDDDDLFDIMLYGGGDRKSEYEDTNNGCNLYKLREYIRSLYGDSPTLAETIEREFGSSVLNRIIQIWKLAQFNTGDVDKDPIIRNLAGLISSSVDVDKLSYLVLDANSTGVPYGRGLDVERFLSNLVYVTEKDMDSEASKKVVGIDSHGVTAAESVALGRYWNIASVYWHHTNRAIMAMFNFVLKVLAIDKQEASFTDYFSAVTGGVNGGKLTETDEGSGLNFLSEKFDKILGSNLDYFNPLKGIIYGKREIYKRILSRPFRIHEDDKKPEMIGQFAFEELPRITSKLRKGIEDSIDLNESELDDLTVLDPQKKKRFKEGIILLDIPQYPRDRIARNDVIVFSEKRETKTYFSNISPLMHNIRSEILANAKKIRVFVHPKVAKYITGHGKLDEITKKLSPILEQELEKFSVKFGEF